MRKSPLTIVYEDRDDDCILASVPAVPCALGHRRSRAEARVNVLDALAPMLSPEPMAPDGGRDCGSPVDGVMRWRSGAVSVFAIVVTALGVVAMAAGGVDSGSADAASSLTAFHPTIAYAVDGDTLRVRQPSGDLDYVRLVGIDTPEDVKPGFPTECGSRAAAASMDRLAPEGAEVTLRYDSVADHEDRYGRNLAHAFIDGRQLELAQLRRGWAYVYRYDGQRFDGLPRFEAAQNTARHEGRGVWGSCGGDFHSAEPGVQD